MSEYDKALLKCLEALSSMVALVAVIVAYCDKCGARVVDDD